MRFAARYNPTEIQGPTCQFVRWSGSGRVLSGLAEFSAALGLGCLGLGCLRLGCLRLGCLGRLIELAGGVVGAEKLNAAGAHRKGG